MNSSEEGTRLVTASLLLHLSPLLASAAILLAGNGMQVTLVAVRGNIEGFSATTIGMVGTGYFAGYIVGCLFVGKLIARSDHIRVFAALAAVAAITTLVLVVAIEPWIWIAARAIAGFCFAGLLAVTESWINEKSGSADRGKILSVYRVVDLAAVTGAQFLIPALGPETFVVFAVIAMLFCFALVPVSLSGVPAPHTPESPSLRLSRVWMLSPVACFGCLTLGLTNGAFRTVGPVYAQTVGLGVEQIAIFTSAYIVGGAMFQFPLGWLSDRFDRRYVLMLATTGAALAGTMLNAVGHADPRVIYTGAFLFGAFALPLYSLSIAHGNDFAKAGGPVELAVGLMLFFGIGATIGPLAGSFVIGRLGAPAFFGYTSIIHACLLLFVLYRMARRHAVPSKLKTHFVGMIRTSPALFRMARKASETKDEDGE